MKAEHIVKLQGKEFVTYPGLLDEAHQCGLLGITTECIQIPHESNGETCIMRAVAKTERGEWTGYGDASPKNVNSMIKLHLIRMAETRAKARALRDLTNIGMTAIEELGGDVEPEKAPSKREQPAPPPPQEPPPAPETPAEPKPRTAAQAKTIAEIVELIGLSDKDRDKYIAEWIPNRGKVLTLFEAKTVIEKLRELQKSLEGDK
jgi:hypothetical protein